MSPQPRRSRLDKAADTSLNLMVVLTSAFVICLILAIVALVIWALVVIL